MSTNSKEAGSSTISCPLMKCSLTVLISIYGTGAPLKEVSVELKGPKAGSGSSSGDGLCQFKDLESGDYTLNCSLAGEMSDDYDAIKSLEVYLPAGSEIVKFIEVIPKALFKVKTFYMDEDDNEQEVEKVFEGAHVEVKCGGKSLGEKISDGQGMCDYGKVSVGSFEVVTWLTGDDSGCFETPLTQRVSVSAGEQKTVSIELDLRIPEFKLSSEIEEAPEFDFFTDVETKEKEN